MKIVHVNNSDIVGGSAIAANRLNVALRKTGVDSVMLVQDAHTRSEHIIPAGTGKLFKSKVIMRSALERVTFFPNERSSVVRHAFSPANIGIDISVHPLIKEADIIHLHWINRGFLSLKSLKILFDTGKPVVWTLHDMWAFTGGCHFAGTCLEFLEKCSYCPFLKKPGSRDYSARQFVQKKQIYRNALIHPVACSKWLRALSSESTLFRNKVVYAIPNPIDTDMFRPLNKQECRSELGLPGDKKLLLFGTAHVADPIKGIRYLFEAINILIDSFPVFKENVEIMVFGKMPHKLKETIPLKIHSHKFVSDMDKLVKIYNAADALVLPSLQENLPNTVLESMACGLPVVGFRTSGVSEMIEHKRSGFIAETKNALSLATGIYETLFIADLKEMSINARKKAIKDYAEDVVAGQYVEVYEKLLKESY